jgi:hypothetical protein
VLRLHKTNANKVHLPSLCDPVCAFMLVRGCSHQREQGALLCHLQNLLPSCFTSAMIACVMLNKTNAIKVLAISVRPSAFMRA